MRLVLTNATLIDCVDPTPVPEASVTVENGHIVEITNGARSPDTANAHVIDLGGAYLLPGLWDVHIHPEYANDPNITVAHQTARFGQNLMRGMSEAGVMGVRCGGAGHFMDVAWRNAFASGTWRAPGVCLGNILTTTGHFLTSVTPVSATGRLVCERVREQIKTAWHIKLNRQAGSWGLSGQARAPFLLRGVGSDFALCDSEATGDGACDQPEPSSRTDHGGAHR